MNFEHFEQRRVPQVPEKKGVNIEKLAEDIEKKIGEFEINPEEKETRRLGDYFKNKISEVLKGKGGIAYAEAFPEVFEKLDEKTKSGIMAYVINLLNEELMKSPLVMNNPETANDIFDYMENSSSGIMKMIIERSEKRILTPLTEDYPSKMDH